MEAKYLSCAETAKLVRAALKKKFVGVKFSVRSETYAGGASIRVGWTDGPTASMVEAVTGQYAGGDFDGMIDLKISKTAWLLPDGSAAIASSPGTTGSMGMIPPEREWMPDPAAKLVRFGADFIFCERKFSAGFLERRLAKIGQKYGKDVSAAKIAASSFGAYLEREPRIQIYEGGGVNDGFLDTVLYREAARTAAAF